MKSMLQKIGVLCISNYLKSIIVTPASSADKNSKE